MKKGLLYTIVLLLVVMILSSCMLQNKDALTTGIDNSSAMDNEKKELDLSSNELSRDDAESTDNKRIEINLSSSRLNRDDAESSMTVNVFGKELTGTYQYTVSYPYYNCDYDTYIYTDEKGVKHIYNVNSKTKELVGYSHSVNKDHVVKGFNYDYNKCLEIARKFLSEYVDVTKYECMSFENSTQLFKTEYDGDFYTFYFVKIINGIKTNIISTVAVNTDGEIDIFSTYMDKMFDGADETRFSSVYDEAKIKSDVEKGIIKAFGSFDTYQIDEVKATRLKDGTLGFEYKVGVNFLNHDPENLGFDTGLDLFIGL